MTSHFDAVKEQAGEDDDYDDSDNDNVDYSFDRIMRFGQICLANQNHL